MCRGQTPAAASHTQLSNLSHVGVLIRSYPCRIALSIFRSVLHPYCFRLLDAVESSVLQDVMIGELLSLSIIETALRFDLREVGEILKVDLQPFVRIGVDLIARTPGATVLFRPSARDR